MIPSRIAHLSYAQHQVFEYHIHIHIHQIQIHIQYVPINLPTFQPADHPPLPPLSVEPQIEELKK